MPSKLKDHLFLKASLHSSATKGLKIELVEHPPTPDQKVGRRRDLCATLSLRDWRGGREREDVGRQTLTVRRGD